MADAGEIKAKVTVEYDGSGIEKAKEDLASLAGAGGTVEGSIGGANDALAQLAEQANSTADSTKALTSGMSELPRQLDGMVTGVQEVNDALGEGQAAIEDMGGSFEALQEPLGTSVQMLADAAPPMQMIAEHAASMNEQIAPVADNFAAIGDSLSQTVPMLPQFAESLHPVAEQLQALNEQVTQTASAFQGISFTDESGNMVSLPEGMKLAFNDAGNVIGPAAAYIQDQLNGVSQSASQTSSAFNLADGSIIKTSDTLNTASDSTNNVAGGFTAINDAASTTNKTLGETSTAVASMGKAAEDASDSVKTIGIGEAFSDTFSGKENVFTAIVGGMEQIAMPLMAIQMIGMAVSAVGQGIYNMAAIAEGPAAHSVGTFTGTIDALTQSATNAGAAFSEGLGQGMMPTLNAINNQTSQSNGGLGGLGEFLGGIGSTLVNLWNVATPAGDPLAGLKGFANQGAALLGMQQPFQGPGPEQQQQIQYQQAIANMPQTVAGQVNQANIQTAQNLADAVTPANLQAQDNLAASQQIYQRVQASYNASHPVNQYDLLQQAQYDAYAAQQQQNYQYQMQNNPAPSYLGSMLGDVFSGNWGGVGADFNQAMTQQYGTNFDQAWAKQGGAFNSIGDFFAAWGNNIANGPNSTYGVAPNNPPPNILGGIGGFFGGLGQDITNGWNWLTNPSPNPAPPPSSGGCFVAGTRVLMADGSERPIETLRIGDRVQTHDGIQRITDCITYAAKQTYTLTFSDGNALTLTDSHPVATVQGWKSIDPESTARENLGLPVTTLEIGDSIYTADGSTCRLISLQKHEITQVYNITVDTVHVYYANNILVHNAKGFTSGGEGSENVSLSHTFTANVTWAANNLEKSFTAAAQWAEQGLVHAATAVAQWAEQGLEHMATAVAQWAEQGLMHEATAVAQWAEQGLQHMATAVAQWAEQDLIHPATAAVQWAEQGLQHTATAVASWIGEGLEHTFNAVANWTAQNLTPNFTVNPSVTMLAEGTSNWSGGPAIVGEAGTEVVAHNGQFSLFDQGAALVNLPAGASVYPMKNLSYAPSTPAQFADGLGDGSIIPLNIGMRGSGAGMPETANIYLQIDGQTFWSATGISLAQNSRVVSGSRSF